MYRLSKFQLLIVGIITLFLWNIVTFAAPLLQVGSKGSLVKEVQGYLFVLKYLRNRPDGQYGRMTAEAVRAFQLEYHLTADGKVGENTLETLKKAAECKDKIFQYTVQASETLSDIAAKFDTSAIEIMVRSNLQDENIAEGQVLTIPIGDRRKVVSRGPSAVKDVPWSIMDKLWKVGEIVSVLDVESGITFTVKRYGGVYHADAEPLTQTDTQSLLKIYGGKWSWDRRAIIVRCKNQYIAGSMNGMPHGGQTIRNNGYRGQFCIHFLGSRVHTSGRVDDFHQEKVEEAAEIDFKTEFAQVK